MHSIVGGKRLSKRLVEIVELSAEGFTDREISVALGIGTDTVETHWKRLRALYDKSNRTGIVAAYIRERHQDEYEDLRQELEKADQRGKDSSEETGHNVELEQAVIPYRQFSSNFSELLDLRKRAESLEQIATALKCVAFTANLGPPHEIVFIKGFDERAFGYYSHEFLSGAVRLPQLIHEDDLSTYLRSIEALFEGDPKSQECVYRVKDQAGEYHWRLDFNSPAELKSQDGARRYHAASFWLDHRLLPGSQALRSLLELRGFSEPESVLRSSEGQPSS
ncbi:MAG: PAS domain-containing protein [Fimbriimonadaceae bacterium]